MINKMIKKYSIHILIAFILLFIIEGAIILQNYKLEKKYKQFANSKIVSAVIDTLENSSLIQNYFEEAKASSEISNRTLEKIAKWYDEMFNYAYDVKHIYFIYKKTESWNYSLTNTHYYSQMVNEIEEILEAEYKNGKNVNDNTDVNKYKEQFDKIFEFNSLFIENMVQKDVFVYKDGRYWLKEKFYSNKIISDKIILEDYFYWNLYNDFFELLNSKNFI